MEENEHQIPHSVEAEKSVLGSVLLSTEASEKALERLKPEDFYQLAHRDIFTAMQRLYNAGKLIDTVTLMDSLEKLGKLESAGGSTYITELALYTPSASNVDYYINMVESDSIRRKLIKASAEIAQEASENTKETDSVLNDAERRIYDIAMRNSSDSVENISPIYHRVYTLIGELMQRDGEFTGIKTGLHDLDDLTSGLQRDDLVVVAGRPATGKTAFALNIAANAAIHEKATVMVFSLEMSKEQLAMRLIASEMNVNMQKLRTADLEPNEILKIADGFNTLGESNLFIDDTPGASVAEIRSKCRRLKAMHGLDVVVIDYLQLMQSTSKRDSRVLEISEMTRGLKILAKELHATVILLSQLSREPDKRKDHTPIMSDLRESGSIEQDADIIMMLYRPAVYPETEEAMNGDNTSYINVVKHRNGATANIRVLWLPELTKYVNIADDVEPN